MGSLRRAIAVWIALVFTFSANLPAAAQALRPLDLSSTAQYARVLRTFNRHLSAVQSRAFANHVRLEAQYYRLDARLLVALVAIESSWHPYATSPVGAGGLGQLMPGTAAGLGVNAYAPFANLSGTAHYLRTLLDRFGTYGQSTRYAYALAGYNAGPGAVQRFGGIPPYTETQKYVHNVMGVWRDLSRSLSSHIDDYMRVAATSVHRRPVMHLARVKPAFAPERLLNDVSTTIAISAVHKHVTPRMRTTVVAAVISPPAKPRKKPFLYYVFGHHHEHAQPPPAITGDDEPALSVVASVTPGQPVSVDLVASEEPVTLIAFSGNQIVAKGRVPSRTTRALIIGLTTASAARPLIIHAYARGHNEAHAPVTIVSPAVVGVQQR
ncbi:MAG: lytic transglycosylase domain-containing protein [Candidatus Eremiobacteraeota bacterium]|nr:lytic transglycosylase domain-containing protein [Candidatus Eremiobacteraeota bacterium]